jgi:hypothetical protein
MTPEEIRKAVKRHCCQHAMLMYGVENFCWARNGVCVFFNNWLKQEPECAHFTLNLVPLFMKNIRVKGGGNLNKSSLVKPC